jgi:uncharacterized protein (TIGR01244 family)
MLELKRINDDVSVAPQISPDDMPAIKSAGYTTVINNRPDGEAFDQPSSEVMKIAAEAAGLTYHHIPLGREGVSPELIDAERAALEGSNGPVLAFCRSGTRSTTLWALSQAGNMPAQEIVAQAAHAGYEISHLSDYLSQR